MGSTLYPATFASGLRATADARCVATLNVTDAVCDGGVFAFIAFRGDDIRSFPGHTRRTEAVYSCHPPKLRIADSWTALFSPSATYLRSPVAAGLPARNYWTGMNKTGGSWNSLSCGSWTVQSGSATVGFPTESNDDVVQRSGYAFGCAQTSSLMCVCVH